MAAPLYGGRERNKDYVRLALAKGVSENNIALHHVFRNAMVPLVQYIPSAFLNTVVGSIYIEPVQHPRHGRLAGHLCPAARQHHGAGHRSAVRLCGHHRPDRAGDLLMVLIDPISFWQERRWPIMLFHMKDQKAAVLENEPETSCRTGPAAWAGCRRDELFTPRRVRAEQAEATAYSTTATGAAPSALLQE